MTRNKSFLIDYQDIDGGFVAFEGSPKRGKISGKGKIKARKLGFKDVYFVKEFKFNLFSVSQMCDKKNSVLFTKTGCLVLSPDFNLLDENQVLLKVTRQIICTVLIQRMLLLQEAEAVNTACYVHNRVLVTKPHNKTPYELLIGRSSNIDFMKPFRCLVTILNTLDHVGKFEGKADDGFLVGYFVNSKAFRVFNSRTKKVKENLHIKFLENKSNVVGRGPGWLFDIDSLTKSINYEPVIVRNQINDDACIEINVNAWQVGQERASNHEYILLPFMPSHSPLSSSTQSSDDKDADEVPSKGDEGEYTYYCQMKVNAATHKLTTVGDGYYCWVLDSAKVKTINEDVRLQALVDGKKIIVNEASIRRDLRLDDAEEEAQIKKEEKKETKVSQDEPPTKEHIPTPSYDPLPSGEERLQLNELMEICTKLSDKVFSLEQIKTNQAAEIEKLKKRVKKLEGMNKKRTHGLKRLYKVRLNARVESYEDEEGLGDQEDASKQGKSIADIDQNEGTTLVDDTQGMMNDQDMFGFNDLDVTTDGEVVTTGDAKVSTTITTDDELTLARALIKIKAAKPKAITTAATTIIAVSTTPEEKGIIMQEPSKTPSPKPVVSSQQQSQPKDKGKAKMVKPERPLKRKEQQKEEEDNIAMIVEWDNTQAMMDVDYELAVKLQEEERGELFIEDKSKLFVGL
nr:retrovirus-related Pol polyprotein from transposon TNT 1-94 [Tanacetum cinerariifolium]